MNAALVSAPLTAQETIASPAQTRAGSADTASETALGWKYLAKGARRAVPALKPAAPAFNAKPRLKFHGDHGFRVIVDSPNNAALAALRPPIAALKPTLRRRIGNISSRGTARDEEIIEMGRLAGRLFSHIFVHETPEADGRREGEVSRLITKGALQTGVRPGNIRTVAAEDESVLACLRFARSGDLLALLVSDVDEGWRLVRDFKPRWKRPE